MTVTQHHDSLQLRVRTAEPTSWTLGPGFYYICKKQTNYLHLFLDESLHFLFPLSPLTADGVEVNKF